MCENTSQTGIDAMSKALGNELILQHIFDRCSMAELETCRLVCKSWRDLSLKTWRKKAVLALDEKFTTTALIRRIKADKLQFRSRPFQSYCFFLETDNEIQFEEIKYIFDTLGDSVNCLKLYNFQRVLQELHELLEKLPNLDHLSLEFANLHPPGALNAVEYRNIKSLQIVSSNICLAFPWKEFLESMPNLEKLELGFRDYGEEETALHTLTQVMIAIKDLRSARKCLNVKELNIFRSFDYCNKKLTELPTEVSNPFLECALPLERLSIDLGEVTNCMIIRKILMGHAGTLKFLRAVRGEVSSLYRSSPLKWKKRVRLEGLKEIRLANGLIWGFNLLRCLDLPNLEKLILEYDHDDDDSRITEEQEKIKLVDMNFFKLEQLRPFEHFRRITLNKLELFEFHPNQKLLNKLTLKMLAKCMPNLKHLTVPLSARTFPTICANWPNLWTLTIPEAESDFKGIDDRALTGLCRREGKNLGTVTSRPPNITNLTQLTNLVISCKRALKRDCLRFTDHSVTHGLLQLPRLHYLSIAFNQISESSMALLEKHVHHLDIQGPTRHEE